jgi:hypothetical protein
MLRVYGFDPAIADLFSKKQWIYMSQHEVDAPRVKVMSGSRVPRRLVNFVSESMHRFLRTNYFGDPNIGFTYLELVTFGMAFASMIYHEAHRPIYISPRLKEVMPSLARFFTAEGSCLPQDTEEIGLHICKIITSLSKVNFRIYGYRWITMDDRYDDGAYKSTVYISSEEPIVIRFVHKEKERLAFRIRTGRVAKIPPYDAVIDRRLIDPEDTTKPEDLDMYIQSHALHRIKERVDIFPAHRRNYYMMIPLLYEHRVAKSPSGQLMLECYTDENGAIVRFGYFPFIVRENKLIVLSFLPLISSGTPEGIYLQKHFGLQVEDMKFLGMGKLSFFLTVDFEQISTLKSALQATEIWNLIEYVAKDPEMKMNFPVDQKKTRMVKKFFERKSEYEAALEQETKNS